MRLQFIVQLMIMIFFLSHNQANSQSIYLSPTGNDGNPGTIDKPLASLTAARDKARVLRKNSQGSQPIEIIAQEGEYLMMQPLFLNTEDGGTASSPVIYKAETGKKLFSEEE